MQPKTFNGLHNRLTVSDTHIVISPKQKTIEVNNNNNQHIFI